MECPKLTGNAINDKDEEFELRVPAFLEFEETEFRTDFDERIVKKVRARFRDISKMRYNHHYVKDIFLGTEAEFVNCQLSYWLLPVIQGPLLNRVDNDYSDTFGDKLVQKINWRHRDEQPCGLWALFQYTMFAPSPHHPEKKKTKYL